MTDRASEYTRAHPSPTYIPTGLTNERENIFSAEEGKNEIIQNAFPKKAFRDSSHMYIAPNRPTCEPQHPRFSDRKRYTPSDNQILILYDDGKIHVATTHTWNPPYQLLSMLTDTASRIARVCYALYKILNRAKKNSSPYNVNSSLF